MLSPVRCRITWLRLTYGPMPRTGAVTLWWSLDRRGT